MKHYNRFLSAAICCWLSVAVCGCAAVKETGKGFIGVSTQVLEEKRKDAPKKSFALDYNRCYLKVKEILSQPGQAAYIYAQNYEGKFISVYLSPADTTCVGIFFTDEPGGNTLIEVSSPSTYAKEEIADRIFTGIDELIKPRDQERTTNVKEESGS